MLTNHQRMCIALARGMIVKGKTVNYVGEVQEMSARPSRPSISVRVEADHAHDAARDVARIIAGLWFTNGEASFVAANGGDRFIASVGVQEWCESGIVTRGCSIAITIHPCN